MTRQLCRLTKRCFLIAAAWVGITSQKSHPFQKSNDLLGFKSFARRHIDLCKVENITESDG